MNTFCAARTRLSNAQADSGKCGTDNHKMLMHGMLVYDALYAWCKEGQDETQTWE